MIDQTAPPRRFTAADQRWFAELSGDWNPIHTDPVQARRTVAGRPVVHGIHLLLHALEAVSGHACAARRPCWLEASFSRFVLVDEAVVVRVRSLTDTRARLDVLVDGAVRSEIVLGFDEAGRPAVPDVIDGPAIEVGREPWAMASEEMAGLRGTIAPAAAASEWTRAFPGGAAWIGGIRLATLGASTRLVGMICPGLHSVYMGLKIGFLRESEARLGFAVGTPRHGLIRTDLAGGGVAGSLTCLVRAAPHRQPRLADLAGLIEPSSFAGARALVIGGSRGLGEVAAKLLALGGAEVAVTYARGADEAAAIAAEIGPRCTILRYDVRADAGAQLAGLVARPSHVYYFATPQIARPTSRFLDYDRLEELMDFFVQGFWNLASALHQRQPDCRLFYPSTTYVAERPKGMAEYAMAKAAGEVLCAEINRTLAPLHVVTARLPQLATDQTLGSHGASGGSAVDELLPILRIVQGNADPVA